MNKQWQAGVADEAWKVIICAREAEDVEQALSFLGYVLTSARNWEEAAAVLRQMTGAEIVDGVLAYRERAKQSVENALKHG